MISTRYNPSETEHKWYQYWMDKSYFHSVPDDREPFTIVIPPPNVTGVLHMGHMLNNTIQDILIRKARMDGKNACWVPGTDHASIATEAKVVRMLREQGIKKGDLTREAFLAHAWEWKEKYGGIILEQLQKLGASCDWERTAFTMDETRSDAVIKVFVDLYRKGKLYRGKRMVNWDPEAKTVLSNEEVIYGLEKSRLFFVRYRVVDSDEVLIVATTRPETIPGDTAVAVHPDDPRYTHLKDKKVIVPGIGREVPIIMDTYVDMEFGTGALKVTPAHDVNDYEIGIRHHLEVVDVFNDDGTMSEAAGIYKGEDRFVVRKKFAADLEEAGLIERIEDYQNNVGRSERTNSVVEPRLSLQWYVDMKALAGPALDAVMKDEVEFFPKNQKNIYRHWMENIRDWCISRQLWWGHRIPAWYVNGECFVAETADEALQLAREKHSEVTLSDMAQDEDVLDTWFSSWLWPISVFDGFRSKEELSYYYPTSVLVTGWDIIFLWVARMIMAGYEWEQARPFKHVYFTGMVRDKLRRKMSKSLGNSPDALTLIEDYGADGVRFGMMSCSPAGGDLLFDEKLCEQGRNFCNKIWNALRLVEGWETADAPEGPVEALATAWIRQRLLQTVAQVQDLFRDYRLSEALMALYKFIWDDFCSWYLEMIKPTQGAQVSGQTLEATREVFESMMVLLHPFMPFVTEEIWHQLRDRAQGEDCVVSRYPQSGDYDKELIAAVERAKEAVAGIREARNNNGVKMKDALEAYIQQTPLALQWVGITGIREMIAKMGNLESLELHQGDSVPNSIAFLAGTEKLFLVLEKQIDAEEERARLQKELEYFQGFVASVQKKLGNERFVSSAPADVVARERQKMEDGEAKVKTLQEALAQLG